MNLEIYLTGKVKTKFILEGVEQYLKWIKPYHKIKITSFPLAGSTSANRDQIKKKEGERYLKALQNEKNVVVLHERGEELSSMEFATFIKKWQNSGTRKLIFIIGGPLGFSDNVLSQNWKKLSLSRMTFTHEMALLVLLEQLYRAETINRGMIYHY